MNELKATPGPWVVDADDINSHGNLVGIYVSQNGEGRICKAFANCLVTTDEELRANAALIAAAPEIDKSLLTMCNLWVSVCNAQGWAPDHVVQYGEALAALKKARGE